MKPPVKKRGQVRFRVKRGFRRTIRCTRTAISFGNVRRGDVLSPVAFESSFERHAGIPLPAYCRAVIYGIVWLLAVGQVAFLVPKFEDSFSRLRETAELPAVTEWLLRFAWLNKALFFVPSVLVLVLLVVADMGIAGLLRGSNRKWLYWVWFVGVIVMGILGAAFVSTALFLPGLKMSGAV